MASVTLTVVLFAASTITLNDDVFRRVRAPRGPSDPGGGDDGFTSSEGAPCDEAGDPGVGGGPGASLNLKQPRPEPFTQGWQYNQS